MDLTPCHDYAALKAAAWSLLAADEANHTVPLGVLNGALDAIARGEPPADPCHARLMHADGALVAAALCSRENWLLTTGPEAAFRALGEALRAQRFAGVAGVRSSVLAFAEGYGDGLREHLRLPLMRLDQPLAPPDSTGALTVAGEAERELVQAWMEAFRVEARMADPPERYRLEVDRGLARGSLRLWRQAGEPVCLVGGRTIAPSGARIGPVYTPPELRGRGHAQAAVTALTALLQQQGARTVFLFTDASNPTSNALYRRIGYQPAGEHLHLVTPQAALR